MKENATLVNKESVLDHQLEEWKTLNEYVNSIDLSFQQPFAIILAIITGLAALLDGDLGEYRAALFILPVGLSAVIAHVSYQFRIVAIIRGHLARLEERMNIAIEENVHMWNSALVETYMAHNNPINMLMIIPMCAFCILVVAYCLINTWDMLWSGFGQCLFFLVYWIVVLGCFAIILLPFFYNNKIRYRTYHEEKVWEDYLKMKTSHNER